MDFTLSKEHEIQNKKSGGRTYNTIRTHALTLFNVAAVSQLESLKNFVLTPPSIFFYSQNAGLNDSSSCLYYSVSVCGQYAVVRNTKVRNDAFSHKNNRSCFGTAPVVFCISGGMLFERHQVAAALFKNHEKRYTVR